jgi:N-acetylglucosamine malate deacetylase 1
MTMPLDILAIAAHRDDVEQTCGGTLLKAAQRGQRTGILDLTRGEMGTRGQAEDRAREANDAAKILGVSWRRALDIPDGRVENTYENRLKVAAYDSSPELRAERPQDSRQDAGATFLTPHRPFKIIYATLYYDIRPSFVVDIGEQFEGKFASILAYKSQFSDQAAGKDLFPAHDEIRSRVDAMARFYGVLGGVSHAEPFLQKEVGLVDDLLALPVKSI